MKNHKSRAAIGKTQKLPFSLANVGTLPAQLHIDLDDKTNFKLIPVEDGEKIIFSRDDHPLAHTAQVSLEPRQEAHMMVVFQPQAPGTFNGSISVTVLDNEFENLKCQLIAEYKATICLTNLPPVPIELQGSSLDSMLCFGDMAINEQKIQSLTIRNDDPIKSVKFTWPDLPYMTFSPKIGHLHPGQIFFYCVIWLITGSAQKTCSQNYANISLSHSVICLCYTPKPGS